MAKLKPLMESLVGDLRHEPGYEKLEAARSERKRIDDARYLPELIKTARQQQAFVRYYITNNPTAQSTSTFIPLLDEFDQNITTPDLEKLKTRRARSIFQFEKLAFKTNFLNRRMFS
jgi:hypothetical protein